MKPSKELEELKKIVLAWRDSYGDVAREIGGGDFLWKDFLEEIEEYAVPYIAGLRRVGAIDEEQRSDFDRFCRGQVELLSKKVQEEEIHG
ncbi:MAG: hypothetical protein IH577_03750 [Deltaproteobacteria bacterium]|nr:hypothetical protein [Deltaproteobacteria bacterium]